jgi:uncharacterized protein (TIGR01777 family)
LRIAIAGATGLVGTELVAYWGSLGHQIHRLARSTPTENTDIPWDPKIGRLVPAQMEGFDAVICLSGAGIADKRWTPARKEVLHESRVGPVSLLARTLADCTDKPECLICASATGYFGADRGSEVLTEDSAPSGDFVGRLCVDWEDAALPAHEAGIRVVNTRFGIILAHQGGALAKMLPIFRLGLGGKLGSGEQFMSWIMLDDAISAIDFALHADEMHGPINVTSPDPLTNAEFTKALGHVVHRPTFARVPEFVLRKALGETADLLLGSNRTFPRRLESAGFRFRYPEIGPALERALH